MLQIFLTILACGIGTFLLRWLPFRYARRQGLGGFRSPQVLIWLAGVGPAAISALLIVSIWGLWSAHPTASEISRTGLALAAVALVRWLGRGGVAVPTLCGAVAYSLLGSL